MGKPFRQRPFGCGVDHAVEGGVEVILTDAWPGIPGFRRDDLVNDSGHTGRVGTICWNYT